jgi:ParB family chromosome partitioning protein
MAEKKRLGRGLDSLIPELETEQAGAGPGAQDVPLRSIELNPRQPRLDLDEGELNRLADSIRSSGIIQPVIVRPLRTTPGMYELVCGERRVNPSRPSSATCRTTRCSSWPWWRTSSAPT